MDDLISRQTAIDAVNRADVIDMLEMYPFTEYGEYETAREVVKRLPSAQPEIIRCKDCKYAHLTYHGECKYCDKWLDDDDFHLTLYLNGDFYCGYAERRTDGTDKQTGGDRCDV